MSKIRDFEWEYITITMHISKRRICDHSILNGGRTTWISVMSYFLIFCHMFPKTFCLKALSLVGTTKKIKSNFEQSLHLYA